MIDKFSTRPKSVTQSIWLLYSFLGIWVAKYIYVFFDTRWATTVSSIAAGFQDDPQLLLPLKFLPIVMIVISLAFYGLIILKIGSGRNWARLIAGVVFVLDLIWNVKDFIRFGRIPVSFDMGLWMLAIILYSVALCLLFKKQSNMWFQEVG